MSIAAAAIAGTAALVGAGISAYGQGKANKLGATLTREGRAYDRKQWEDTNAYNSPAMQMQRLREAGLNPNLVYGGGATQHASLPPAAKIPEVRNVMESAGHMNMTPAISMYQDWKVKEAQVDNLKKQGDLMDQEKLIKALDQINKQIKNDTGAFELSQKQKMGQTQVNILGENLRRILLDMDAKKLQMDINRQMLPVNIGEKTARMRNMLIDSQNKQMEYDYNSELRKAGLPFDTPWYVKLGGKWLLQGAKEAGQTLAPFNNTRPWNKK